MKLKKQYLLILSALLILSSLLCRSVIPEKTALTTPQVNVEELQATVKALQAQITPPGNGGANLQTTQPVYDPASGGQSLEPTPYLGSIAGSLGYPGEVIPRLRIVATNVDTGELIFIDTKLDQTQYIIGDLPPGSYTVVAYGLDPDTLVSAGFSQAVTCGLTQECTDHTLIVVTLNPGQEISGVDPIDWYAPEDSFPPPWW